MAQTQPAKVLLLLLTLVSMTAAQETGGNSASKPPHVYTNDDFPRPGTDFDDALPEIPGLIHCNGDRACFLRAIDEATPAALRRTETAEPGTAIVNSRSVWWTTEFAGERCTVSFRVDAVEAKVNEKLMAAKPKAEHDAAEARIEAMVRDFQEVRGKTETCTLAVRDLKALMSSSSWTLLALGPMTNFGKACSGPGFDSPNPSQPKTDN